MERQKKYYSALTRRLLIAFFCLSIVPIVSFAWIMKDAVEGTNIVKLKELAASTIEHRSDVISLFLNEKISLLSMMVSFYPQDFFFNQENLDKLYLAMGPKGDIVDLQVIDAAGAQHGYVGPYRSLVKDKSYGDAPWFKETLIGGVHVSDAFTGYRNVPHFVVAVTDSLKTFVLRATINSSIFNSLLRSAQLGTHSDALIINRDGQLQTPSLLGATELSEVDREHISFDSRAQAVVTDSFIYKTRWIGDGQWLLVLKASVADSLGYYLTLRNRLFIIVGVIIVLSVSAAVATSVALAHYMERADKEHAAHSLQFAHMEKMATIGRLAAGIAHEINNPLQMITNQAGWISELLPEEDPAAVKNLTEYRNSAERIRYHVKRAGTITHRLLGFSKKITAQNDQVQINDLLNETLSFVEREAENNNVVIVRNLADDLPAIMTDGPQLQQVFLNLIDNAFDAVGPKGVVEITTRKNDGKLVVECADNGPGIAPEQLKQIFEPFFTTKTPDKGTGLGLYISYDIVKKLGGSISVENREGGGALFRVVLPVAGYSKQE